MEGFKATIKETSKVLTPRERIMVKDTSNAIRLDEATQSSPLVFSPASYAILDIHNEKAKEDKDYLNYVIIDRAGNKYVTGSESFFSSFKEIWDEMAETDEEYDIEVYRIDSKNYKGKQFITCSIV